MYWFLALILLGTTVARNLQVVTPSSSMTVIPSWSSAPTVSRTPSHSPTVYISYTGYASPKKTPVPVTKCR